MRRTVPLLLCLLALAGCAGGGDGDAAQTTPTTTAAGTTTGGGGPAVDPGQADPVLGEALLRFVRAAAQGDAGAMWSLLSIPTRASIGPTLADFSGGTAAEFQEGLGTLAGSARVVLSRRIDDQYGVAAIAGDRAVEGKQEYFAYGTALLNESGVWKLELGGIVIAGLKPDPLAGTGDRPRLASNVGAAGELTHLLMWLDGRPLRVANEGSTPFTAKLSATPAEPLKPGRHTVVTFAATPETATAIAWTFSVEPRSA